MVKYVTYHESKSQTLALNTIDSELYLLQRDFDDRLFCSMCGTICYALLYNIPDYDLVDRNTYTIEMICFHVPPTLAKSTHLFMEYLSELCIHGVSEQNLLGLLRIPELTSVVLLSHIQPRRLLCCFYNALGYVTDNAELYGLAELALTDDETYLRLNRIYGE